jgi:peptidoglycan/LPS O-acetylase OafA/YrhL
MSLLSSIVLSIVLVLVGILFGYAVGAGITWLWVSMLVLVLLVIACIFLYVFWWRPRQNRIVVKRVVEDELNEQRGKKTANIKEAPQLPLMPVI